MKYIVQAKAPAGNWYDCLGTDSMASAKSFAKWLRKQKDVSRIVERSDTPVD